MAVSGLGNGVRKVWLGRQGKLQLSSVNYLLGAGVHMVVL